MKSRAVVLHSTRYSETSLIVRMYTEEAGAVSFIVSGVRSGKSRFSAGLFQPLSLVEVISTSKPGQTLSRITDIQWSPPFTSIGSDLIKNTVSIFLAEVLSRSLKEEDPNPALFGFLHSSIQIFDLSKISSNRFHIHFLIQLTRYTGFFPNGSYSESNSYFDMREGSFTSSMPMHADLMDHHVAGALWKFMNEGYHESEEFHVDPVTCKELLRQLVTYYELHLTQGKSIHSHKILADVMA